jgi:hypothetical protein
MCLTIFQIEQVGQYVHDHFEEVFGTIWEFQLDLVSMGHQLHG